MIQQIDFAVLDWIQANLRCTFLDFMMPVISLYAQYGILFICTGIVMLMIRSRRICGAAVLAGLVSGGIIGNLCLKNLIARSRPCWINTDINMLVAVPRDYSFPSGHTMHSFIVATVLMRYDKRLGIPAFVMAFLVGISRMYLYVHFPTDVLVGGVLGVVIGIGVVVIFDRVHPATSIKASGANSI